MSRSGIANSELDSIVELRRRDPSKPQKRLLRLNIGGREFRISSRKLEQYPLTRLGQICATNFEDALESNLCDGYLPKKGEFYFDRSAYLFDIIAQFYRTKHLHVPETICRFEMVTELKYWKLMPTRKYACPKCADTVYRLLKKKTTTVLQDMNEIKIAARKGSSDQWASPTAKLIHKYNDLRVDVFYMMENAESSWIGKLYAILTIFFICITVAGIVVQSLPISKTLICEDEHIHTSEEHLVNDDVTTNLAETVVGSQSNESCHLTDKPIFLRLDTTVIAWFTMDYVARFWAAPNRLEYVVSGFSIVDLLSVMPFYIELGVHMGSSEITTNSDYTNLNQTTTTDGVHTFASVGRLFRIFRILRVFKLARYSFGMKLIATALMASANELLLMTFYTMLGSLIFSTVLYYSEGDDPQSCYRTIPGAGWWSITTLLSYSECMPTGIVGQILAMFGSFVGILLLAFPITVVVDKFGRIYEQMKDQEPHPDDELIDDN